MNTNIRRAGRVTIYDDGEFVASFETGADGAWSYTTQKLTLGAHNFTAKFGNEISNPYSLRVIVMELAAPSLKEAAGRDTIDLQAILKNSVTVIVPRGELNVGDRVVLLWRGTSESGDLIEYDDEGVIGIGEEHEKPFNVPRENLDSLVNGMLTLSYEVITSSDEIKYSYTTGYTVIRTAVQVFGCRSQSGPHYYSNSSLLSASVSGSGEISWQYVGNDDVRTENFFLDTSPEKELAVILRREGVEVERKILRPSNITGVLNLPDHPSGCITKDDGSLYGWSENTEMLPPVDLVNVSFTVGGGAAYAVIKQDGTVRAWGVPELGGAIPYEVQPQLTQVKKLAATAGAFLALRADGQVVAWGHSGYGGTIPSAIGSQIADVIALVGSTSDFSVVLRNGSVFSWGESWPDGIRVNDAQGTQRVYASNRAFAGIKGDGSVVAWGSSEHGGSIPAELISQLVDVKLLSSTSAAFAALTSDERVVSWGDSRFGGNNPVNLRDVRHVTGSTTAFCALKKEGSLFAWGEPEEGGNLPPLTDSARSVTASYGSFAAVLENRSLTCWGLITAAASIMPVAGAYAAGAHFVALTTPGNLEAIGGGAPDLTLLEGQVSYYQ